jgi:hypothetical protein
MFGPDHVFVASSTPRFLFLRMVWMDCSEITSQLQHMDLWLWFCLIKWEKKNPEIRAVQGYIISWCNNVSSQELIIWNLHVVAYDSIDYWISMIQRSLFVTPQVRGFNKQLNNQEISGKSIVKHPKFHPWRSHNEHFKSMIIEQENQTLNPHIIISYEAVEFFMEVLWRSTSKVPNFQYIGNFVYMINCTFIIVFHFAI